MSNSIYVVRIGFCADNLPQEIIVDTNVLIDYVDKGSAVHGEAECLIRECIIAGKSIFTTNTVMYETQNWIDNSGINAQAKMLGIDVYLGKYRGQKGRKKLQVDIAASNPSYYEQVHNDTQMLMTSIQKVVEVIDDDQDVATPETLGKIQRLFKGEIGVFDASVIAMGNAYGINTIATSDYGFTKGDNLNLIALPKGSFCGEKSTTNFLVWTDAYTMINN